MITFSSARDQSSQHVKFVDDTMDFVDVRDSGAVQYLIAIVESGTDNSELATVCEVSSSMHSLICHNALHDVEV